MKAQAKKTITMFGGAAALVLTVGIGAVGVSPVGSAATTPTHLSSGMAAIPNAAAPGANTGVHNTRLTDCIVGLDPC